MKPSPLLVVGFRLSVFALLTGAGLFGLRPALSQDEEPPEAVEPPAASSAGPGSIDMIARQVGGFPVLLSIVRFEEFEIEGHLLYDPGLAVPFQIHSGSLGGLALDPQIANGLPVTITIDKEIVLRAIPIETARYRFLEEHTKIHAAGLKEIPIIGIIGPSAFGSNVVELDLSQDLLRTMGIATDAAREAEIPFTTADGKIVINGTGPAGVLVRATVTTQTYDLTLDPALLALARKNGATPNALELGDIKWGERAAVRFDEAADPQGPGALQAIIGAEALVNCTVTVWPERQKIALQAREAGPFPQAVQDYFFALADRKPEAVAAFIETGPRRRLLDEACLKHWEIRLEDVESSQAQLEGALDTIARRHWAGSRSEVLLDVVDTLEQEDHAQRDALVEHGLALATRESSKAVEATTVHDVHVRIGRRALGAGDLQQARRHLLSAAFGMPKSAECNFWLGEVYREMGWPERAWSRYFQALLDEELEDDDPLGPDSLEQLYALNEDPEFRAKFNMILAEQYMSGRLQGSEFHAASRYRFVKRQHPHRVRMAELFIDSTDAESGGLELAFQALNEYFEDEVVLLSYHLEDPMHSEAAEKRLAFYKKSAAPLAVFDGKPEIEQSLGLGNEIAEDAAVNYPLLQAAALPDEAPEGGDWQIDAQIEMDGATARIGVGVSGEAQPEGLNLVVLVCERSVMALEENGVYFHHFVVRDLLTPAAGIDVAKALKEPVQFELDVAELRKRLAAGPDDAKPTPGDAGPFIDAKQLMLIGCVQRESDSRIVAASRFGFPQQDEQK